MEKLLGQGAACAAAYETSLLQRRERRVVIARVVVVAENGYQIGDRPVVIHDAHRAATPDVLQGVWLFFVAPGQGKPSPYGCARG